MTTAAGSLGMGLSFSLGQALAARLDGRGYRVYGPLGDGDCNEGATCWDLLLKHYGLTPERIAEAARGLLAQKGR